MAGEVETLTAQLRDPGPACCAAAERLAQLGTEAQPAAAELVAATARDDAREWAVAALEGLGPPPADQLAPLVALAEAPAAITAYWAVTLIGRLGGDARSAVPALVRTLAQSPHVEVRQQAAWSLGRCGRDDPLVRAGLSAAAGDADPRLARLAREALAAFDSK